MCQYIALHENHYFYYNQQCQCQCLGLTVLNT
jgi:hypothetical protein